MITEALLHFPGLGPARRAQLQQVGIRSWQDILDAADQLPVHVRDSWTWEARRCLAALETEDVDYLARTLHAKDKWRLLASHWDETTWFDIETSGLDHDAQLTVIACWHRGELKTFVEHENLDDFLPLLDEVKLLASFNGNAFDVPRVLDAFHIPHLPCPHLDLRWICYHQGYAGGLKQIADREGIHRPRDIDGADGAMAVSLWCRWKDYRDRAALQRLLRYCAADVILLRLLAIRLANRPPDDLLPGIWELLPPLPQAAAAREPSGISLPPWSDFGTGSPFRLRARRRSG